MRRGCGGSLARPGKGQSPSSNTTHNLWESAKAAVNSSSVFPGSLPLRAQHRRHTGCTRHGRVCGTPVHAGNACSGFSEALCAVRLGLALGCRCSPHAMLLLPALTDGSMHPEPWTASSDPCGTSVRWVVLQCAPRAFLLDGLKKYRFRCKARRLQPSLT